MHSEFNADGLPLIRGLEHVNDQVRMVHAAWAHFSQWREIGGGCAMTTRQLLIARGLLMEAIEDWALAVGRLLGLAREREGCEELSASLERSLRRAAGYLRMMENLSPDAAEFARAEQRAYRE